MLRALKILGSTTCIGISTSIGISKSIADAATSGCMLPKTRAIADLTTDPFANLPNITDITTDFCVATDEGYSITAWKPLLVYCWMY